MGTYTDLMINNYSILSSKSHLRKEVRMLFSESDKQINSENIRYVTTIENAIKKLEYRGYTLEKVKNDFDICKNILLNELKEINESSLDEYLLEYSSYYHTNNLTTDILESVNIKDFIDNFKRLRLKKISLIDFLENEKNLNLTDLEKYIIDNDGYSLNFFTTDIGYYLRVYLESCSKEELLIQDITELVSSGYYNEKEPIINNLLFKHDGKPLIITEGKTDWKHLKKALNIFNNDGLYKDLDIKFEEYETTDMGDGALDNMVKSYCKTKQSRKHIFMFDRDNNTYVKKYAKKEFNTHQNNVYSFCIPKISDELDRICIEFYYKKEDLRTEDKDGKRIFIGEDFLANGNSKCGQYVTAQRNVKELDILDSDKKVYLRDDIEWNNNIALSKNDFTNNIINDVDGFNNFDIENFKLIFDVIEKIVNEN